MGAGGLIQPTISLEMPVPSQGHYGFPSVPVVDWFFCLLTYEFCLSFWKIAGCSVILLLPLFFPPDIGKDNMNEELSEFLHIYCQKNTKSWQFIHQTSQGLYILFFVQSMCQI